MCILKSTKHKEFGLLEAKISPKVGLWVGGTQNGY